MKLLVHFTALLLLISFYAVPSFSTVIEGVVLSEEGPIDPSNVQAYVRFQDIKNGSPAYISIPGEKKGFYKIELPPGIYYLTASGHTGEKKHFSFHGFNPVKIEDNDLWIPFMVTPETRELFKESSESNLTGMVTFKDAPVTGAQVSIYPTSGLIPDSEPQASKSVFKGMGFLTATTDEHGIFRMRPVPGEYVIIARKRNSNVMRPLEKGDLFCYFAGNPVTITDAKETWIETPCYPKDDLKSFLSEIAYSALIVKKSGADSVRLKENKLEPAGDVRQIQGRVTGLYGKPVKNIYVMAYRGKPHEMFQMHYIRTMPDYMIMTDDNGYYSIDITERGTYYLVARELIGESPVRGELYGLYEGNSNHFVSVDENSLKDMNIIVSEVMGEHGKKPEAWRHKPDVKKVNNHFYEGDVVIDRDTVWNGEVMISGIVHVARPATLTINPGTIIKFKKNDRNGDGVGDAMIKVSGRLTAEGAPDKTIRFTSGEERPGRMDWAYLLFFASGEESTVRHCVFEYAFTGVQVHFSKVSISDSVFANNHEGIKFGRAELIIKHNDIFDNTYGIRHTRVEEPVEIKFNNIRNNSVGIFLVPSNQNIADFSLTYDKKGFLPAKQFIVTSNNIAYNTEYNYRLGERQGYDISLKDNWWGRDEDQYILNTIYDENADSSIGNVLYKPYLKIPVKDAGAGRKGEP